MSELARRLARLRQQAGTSRAIVSGTRGADVESNLPGTVVLSGAPVAGPDPVVLGCVPVAFRCAQESSGEDGTATSRSGRTSSHATIETLRRLLGVRERRNLAPRPFAADRELPGEEISPGLRLQTHLLPWPRCVDAALDLSGLGLELIDPARLRFFDTETTGLAGGTGTRAFQIGIGDWYRGALRVRQLTLTTLGAEATMLDTFARWLDHDALLVSYNGRSYDAPLLNTRFRLARRASPLPALAHLDLLYPVRRRYRGVWANCRLATIERELLGVQREDDLPGSEAPRAWLDYLRGGSARDLRRVAEHNRQDIVSLAALLLRLADAT